MKRLCPTCAILRAEWLAANEKWEAAQSSNDPEQELAARLAEHRLFRKCIERILPVSSAIR